MTNPRFNIILGDALTKLQELPPQTVQTCVTSPPYFQQRDYGVAGQLGLEREVATYISNLVNVFREVRRTLREDGTCWLNLGDSYFQSESKKQGLKKGDLVGIPWRVALALQADGWFLRSDIIWEKPSCLPESVRDRPTKSHEYLFLLSKSRRYYYDQAAIREPVKDSTIARYRVATRTGPKANPTDKRVARMNPVLDTPGRKEELIARGRNKRTVWTVAPSTFRGQHYATFPPRLITPCILAGSRAGDLVLDPFTGSGTTGLVALKEGREFVGIELNPTYRQMAQQRLENLDMVVSK